MDTSALGRVLLAERDGTAVLRDLSGFDEAVSSRLLRTELLRLALREDLVTEAEQLLTGIALMPLDDSILTAAERLSPPIVATLDAIHLTTALRLARGRRLDALMTYDARLAAGARHHGIAVLAPS